MTELPTFSGKTTSPDGQRDLLVQGTLKPVTVRSVSKPGPEIRRPDNHDISGYIYITLLSPRNVSHQTTDDGGRRGGVHLT